MSNLPVFILSIYRGLILNPLVLMLLAACCLFIGCASSSSEEDNRHLESSHIETPTLVFHTMARQQVTRSVNTTLLVFIHGTPGSWDIFTGQLNNDLLASKYVMVAIDRPGWGQTRYKQGEFRFSLADQSLRIAPLLRALKQKYQADKLIIVGHSLGASLVPRIAMDYPELVDGAIAIAGDLTAQYSASHWYNYAADFVLLRWMLPKDFQRSNDEVLALDGDLQRMAPMWPDLAVPLLVIQGTDDGLVDPRHADFAQSITAKANIDVVRIEGAGHLVHIKREAQINQIMMDYIDGLTQRD